MEACPDGSSNNPTTGACEICPAGTHSSEPDQSTNLRSCAECIDGYLQWRPNQTSCVQCPPEGINCYNKSAIDVLPRYFRPEDDDRFDASILVTAVRCPMADACIGGTVPGEASCAEGHSGPLCAACDGGHYRSSTGCRICPDSVTSSYTWAYVLLIVYALILIAAILAAFRGQIRVKRPRRVVVTVEETQSAEQRRSRPASKTSPSHLSSIRRWLGNLARLVYASRVEISTHVKIVLGFAQARPHSTLVQPTLLLLPPPIPIDRTHQPLTESH